MKNNPIRGYYYLTPVWFVLEAFLWPGIRAEAIVGAGTVNVFCFYLVETVIGIAFWKGVRGADWAALAENFVYLVFSIRFVVFGPLDIVLGADVTGSAGMEDAMHSWVRSLPGVLVSLVYVVAQVYAALYKKGLLKASDAWRP